MDLDGAAEMNQANESCDFPPTPPPSAADRAKTSEAQAALLSKTAADAAVIDKATADTAIIAMMI